MYADRRGFSGHQKAIPLLELGDEPAMTNASLVLAQHLGDFLSLELHILLRQFEN